MEKRNSTTLFKGFVVNIEQVEVRMGEKGWHTYQIIRHPGGVAVLPLHEDGTVSLIRQLRPAAGAFLLELPAGRRDPGEEPAVCGMRELAEETGLIAGKLESLGTIYSSPGVMDEVIHLFLATDLTQQTDNQEPYENIETLRIPIAEALEMARDGRIADGKTIAALFRVWGRK
ncbi:NUDIX hydrolase [Geobacter sp. DSM 9736]|uniref:NUDIX hydrolase n=1 Tax=Geobacter sp. DSM 9736 TaxID=1277350 RepID=UPI000B4FE46D|nr:NUDIX hydrolase [Geobacter sp. DSM 9736]SNB47451.1 ADP-ribose pyrophosphatase [Geobacter sp. DSM 9736]